MVTKQWPGPRATLLGTELFVGASAAYGLPLDYLSPLPWRSWTPAGIALLLVVAAPMLAAAALVLRGHQRAADASITAGALLAGWVAVQVLIVGPRFWLQPLMFIVGLGVAALALRWRARQPAEA